MSTRFTSVTFDCTAGSLAAPSVTKFLKVHITPENVFCLKKSYYFSDQNAAKFFLILLKTPIFYGLPKFDFSKIPPLEKAGTE